MLRIGVTRQPVTMYASVIDASLWCLGRWTVLSQDEHPHLGLPFYHLHPCQTAARMACLRSLHLSPTPPLSELQPSTRLSAESQPGLLYLLQWFSLIAPVLDLPLPAVTFARLVSSSND